MFSSGQSNLNSSMRYSAGDILNAHFGEKETTIKAEFRKTIQIRNYETEVYSISSEIKLDPNITGYRKAFVQSLLQAQLELIAYRSLRLQNKVQEAEYNNRRDSIIYSINYLAAEFARSTGENPGDFMELIKDGENN